MGLSKRYNYLITSGVAAALLLGIGGLDAYLQSYNEASKEPGPLQVQTIIGSFASLEPMGLLPVALIRTLKKWPDRAACTSDASQNIISWDSLLGAREIEICMQRVLSHAPSQEAMEKILLLNGFEGEPYPLRKTSHAARLYDQSDI